MTLKILSFNGHPVVTIKNVSSPGQVARLAGASPSTTKHCGFDPWSGIARGLGVGSVRVQPTDVSNINVSLL